MKTQTLCKNISKKLVLLAGLCMTAAGCSSAPASSTTSSTAHSATAKTADGTVYENYGRTITIDHVPEKVLTFGPNCTELFAALGLQDKIIGTTLNNHSRGPLPEYADALADVPQLNYGSASREAVMGSDADFIYGIDWEFGEEGVRLDELDAFGMNAYVSSAKTLDEVYKEIEDLGKIFGIEEKASDLIAEQKERLADVEAKIEQIRSDPALSQLEAVQKERFIPISLESILPGIRLAHSVESLHDGLTKVMPSSKS
ncbi:ABC transporter substrate-binding protein [Allobaculum mucilyticum]|uniref:ABC transporter substrate-binding protein n=1 Tax=Allobaculum mucilyticum TaxID=2834459 RepID=UPI001E61678F|nr:ABC transporter substrate-binding protein [Allobaculum mucilyticum]UNT95171.1 ABC transporter substrate-binding protein [Allobaculum mucilyticum]